MIKLEKGQSLVVELASKHYNCQRDGGPAKFRLYANSPEGLAGDIYLCANCTREYVMDAQASGFGVEMSQAVQDALRA
jgi:hypothetical protein